MESFFYSISLLLLLKAQQYPIINRSFRSENGAAFGLSIDHYIIMLHTLEEPADRTGFDAKMAIIKATEAVELIPGDMESRRRFLLAYHLRPLGLKIYSRRFLS